MAQGQTAQTKGAQMASLIEVNGRAVRRGVVSSLVQPNELWTATRIFNETKEEQKMSAGNTVNYPVTSGALRAADRKAGHPTIFLTGKHAGCDYSGRFIETSSSGSGIPPRLQDCDLRWATFANPGGTVFSSCRGVIFAGIHDGYTVIGYLGKGKRLTIRAGCRTFTVPQARKHWSKRRVGSTSRQAFLPAVNMIVATAKAFAASGKDGGYWKGVKFT